MAKRQGRKSAAQTPAPKKDRIYGSKKNPKGSASSEKTASKIKVSQSILKGLEKKLKEFREKYPSKKNVTLADLKAVFRRGAGAFSKSYRPFITGGAPNSRNAWAYARVNKFLKKAAGQKVKAAYVQDDDLLKREDGGEVFAKGGLMAPNGKKSNLTPEQYKLVRTPQFKAWFGDWENDPDNASKVVDENGEPLVVYHGTSASFNTFKEEEKGRRGGLNEKFWSFTTNIEQAKIYALDNRVYGSFSTPRIIPAFLNIREMPSYDNQGKFYRELEVWGGYKHIDIFQLQDWHSRGFNMGVEFKEVDGFEVKNTIEMEERDDLDKTLLIGNTYYVKNSNQIKLADGTNKTFDPNKKDIRYSKGGQFFNDKELLAKWKRGESIGFTATAHLKAKGLIPRSDGTKRKSPQYKKQGGLIGGFEDLTDEWLSKKIEIFLYKVKPIKFYFVDPNTNTLTIGFDKYYSQDAAQKVYEEAISSKEFFHAPSLESTYDSKTGDLVFKIKLKKAVEYSKGGNIVYSAIFFDENEIVKRYGQVLPNLYSHHSTIEFKPQSISDLPIGDRVNISIIGRLTTDKVDVLLVNNPFSKNKYPHITLSTSEGVKPFESNKEIEQNINKVKPLNDYLEGVVGYFDGSRDITKYNDGGEIYEDYEDEYDEPYPHPSSIVYQIYHDKIKLDSDTRYVLSNEEKITFNDVKQDSDRSYKPKGLWYAFGSGWAEYTFSNMPNRANEYHYLHKIEVNDNVLRLDTKEKCIQFTEEYSTVRIYDTQILLDISFEVLPITIDWVKVAKKYSGIEVTNPREWSFGKNSDRKLFWLYGWDVPSGCIWNQDGIKSIKLLYSEDGGEIFAKGGLIAPNGKKSNLTPEQYKLVRTPQFKAWFGDWENDPDNASKVVDENGEPLVVYHGTNEKFNVFEPSKTNFYATTIGTYFFTDKKEVASNFGKNILSVFLLIDNPTYLDGRSSGRFNTWDLYDDEGNYGFIVSNSDTGGGIATEYAVENSNQIKLADGTNKTFDPNKKDIRYSKGGEIDPKVLRERWAKKKDALENLANNIQRLRSNLSKDLKEGDEKERLTALVVKVMDETGERVGNNVSADNGHFGVTGLKKKHIKVNGSNLKFKYTGKSGVEHEKEINDSTLANAMREAINNSPSEYVFETSDGFRIKNDRVNRYLNRFDVSAKDLRGYSANKWIITRLKSVKDREILGDAKKRKTKFNEIVKDVAEKVGHGRATLKKHYLLPSLEREFINHGKIVDLSNIKRTYEDGGEVDSPRSAKQQFATDLQEDKDFKEAKKRAIYDERGRTYGTPNVIINDPYVRKARYKHIKLDDSDINDDDMDFAKGGETKEIIALPDTYSQYERLKEILRNQGYDLTKNGMARGGKTNDNLNTGIGVINNTDYDHLDEAQDMPNDGEGIFDKGGLVEYNDPYVNGLLEVDDSEVRILDWNSKYTTKGGTEKSLQAIKNRYSNLNINAVDVGYYGESSYSYWDKMLEKGLIDSYQDDDGLIHVSQLQMNKIGYYDKGGKTQYKDGVSKLVNKESVEHLIPTFEEDDINWFKLIHSKDLINQLLENIGIPIKVKFELGEGANGTAWMTENDTVLKLTKNGAEAYSSYIIFKNQENFRSQAEIYNIFIINDYSKVDVQRIYFIEKQFLNPFQDSKASSISHIYNDIEATATAIKYSNDDRLEMLENIIRDENLSEQESIYARQVFALAKDVDKEARAYGINLRDNHSGNVGFDNNGKLLCYDCAYLGNKKLNKGGNLKNKNMETMKVGGEISQEEKKEIYAKWKKLVNMSKSELQKFYDSEEGKQAGLTPEEAKEAGIDSGRESARWIMKMKDTKVADWTPTMWMWAKKQISFVSRMSGNKGKLVDENGKKTRKYLSLLIWGNDPKKKASGGDVEEPCHVCSMSDAQYQNLPALGEMADGKRFVYRESVFAKGGDTMSHVGDRYLILECMGEGGITDTLNLKVIQSSSPALLVGSTINRPIRNIINKGREIGTTFGEAITGNYKKGGELNPDNKEVKNYFEHKSGDAGGLLVGKRHSEGGIKAINNSTGQPLEMEGGEVVITRDAVSDPAPVTYEGKQMTKREVLSEINQSGGGVAFADGGVVGEKNA